MKHVLVIALLLGGCATLSETTHEAAAEVDEGAQKLQRVIEFVRQNVQPYAQLAVNSCGATPLNVESCQEIEKVAGQLFAALDKAQAALDAYNAGKGDFIDAYEAVEHAIGLAEGYAREVVDLVSRASV